MNDLFKMENNEKYVVTESSMGIRLKFVSNEDLIVFYNNLKTYNLLYRETSNNDQIILYSNVRLTSSNANLKILECICNIKKLRKTEFLVYLRKQKLEKIFGYNNI
jgi:hypothetical protein